MTLVILLLMWVIEEAKKSILWESLCMMVICVYVCMCVIFVMAAQKYWKYFWILRIYYIVAGGKRQGGTRHLNLACIYFPTWFASLRRVWNVNCLWPPCRAVFGCRCLIKLWKSQHQSEALICTIPRIYVNISAPATRAGSRCARLTLDAAQTWSWAVSPACLRAGPHRPFSLPRLMPEHLQMASTSLFAPAIKKTPIAPMSSPTPGKNVIWAVN